MKIIQPTILLILISMTPSFGSDFNSLKYGMPLSDCVQILEKNPDVYSRGSWGFWESCWVFKTTKGYFLFFELEFVDNKLTDKRVSHFFENWHIDINGDIQRFYKIFVTNTWKNY